MRLSSRGRSSALHGQRCHWPPSEWRRGCITGEVPVLADRVDEVVMSALGMIIIRCGAILGR